MDDVKFDILGIGNAIIDVVAQVDNSFLSRHDMLKGTMILVDAERAEAIYAAMPPGEESSGGSAGNTCAVAAALGARVAYLGKVAMDQLGAVFRHDISAAGVHFPSAPLMDGAPTARCLVLVTPDGQRTMNTYLGACVSFGEDDVDETLVANSAITYLEGYLFDPPAAQAAFRRAAASAHANGRQVALSLSDPFCVDRHRAAFRDLVTRDVDILFANEAEITSLYEENSFEAAAEAVRRDVALAVLTRSEAGSVILRGAETGGGGGRADARGGYDRCRRCLCGGVPDGTDGGEVVAGVWPDGGHRGGGGHQPLRRAARNGFAETGPAFAVPLKQGRETRRG